MPFFLKSKEQKQQAFKRAFYAAKILDDSIGIPFTPYRIGIDALIGLVPIGGDFLGALFSSYILIEGLRTGCRRRILLKMLLNLGVDFIAGLIPIIGDIFDIAWKANIRNVALMEKEIFADNS